MIAPQTITGLAQLLQLNLDTALPDGRTALLRFWDPRVLISLAELLDPGQREVFLATSTNGICCIRANGHGLEGSMLKLSEAQWEELQARDARQFATAVCDQFLGKRPDMLTLPGRAAGPTLVTIESAGYFDKKGFKDRPGGGWMLYLPRVLTVQQVPEARALVPVLGVDKKQIGTIIVSVTDAPFSDENPEHVKIANSIEIRLVDQDLLPRYADF